MTDGTPIVNVMPGSEIEARRARPARRCRLCGADLVHTFVDLGMSPLCESYLTAEQLNRMEPFYPLRVHVCPRCFLVQLGEYVSPADIFTEYAYFSSYSKSWVEHARVYTEAMRRRFALNERSFVIELASNDGYLLQHFVAAGVPVLGIEPAVNVAAAAVAKQVPTRCVFFGVETARDLVARGEHGLRGRVLPVDRIQQPIGLIAEPEEGPDVSEPSTVRELDLHAPGAGALP